MAGSKKRKPPLRRRNLFQAVEGNIERQSGRGGELAPPIPLSCRFQPVEPALLRQSRGFRFKYGRHSLNSQLLEVLDPMFPHPINAVGGLVAQVSAVEVSAKENDVANILPDRSP